MAEAGCPEEQWEVEAFEDEFGEIIKTRSGKNKLCLYSCVCEISMSRCWFYSQPMSFQVKMYISLLSGKMSTKSNFSEEHWLSEQVKGKLLF